MFFNYQVEVATDKKIRELLLKKNKHLEKEFSETREKINEIAIK